MAKTLCIMLAGIFLFSCSDRSGHLTGMVPEARVDLVSITREQMQAIGLEIGSITRQQLSQGIMVSGYLDTPPQHQAMASSNISGKTVRVNFLPGDYIHRGQEIIRLESLEFLKLQQDYLESRSALNYLEDEYKRQKLLNENNVNARKVFLLSEKEYYSMLARYNSLSAQFMMLGADREIIDRGELTRFISVSSPISGYLTDVYVVLGEFIQNQDDLFRVVNPDELHAELNVFEKDILKVRKGQQVEIQIPQMPDTVIMGEVFLVGKELDERTRTVKIHVEIPPQDHLVSGMYVEGRVLTGVDPVFTIPTSALIREERGSYIYVLDSQDDRLFNFKKVYVDVGSEKKGFTEVKLPLDFDEAVKVAISGVYYLSSG